MVPHTEPSVKGSVMFGGLSALTSMGEGVASRSPRSTRSRRFEKKSGPGTILRAVTEAQTNEENILLTFVHLF